MDNPCLGSNGRLAVAPDLPVAILLFDRERRLERREHQVPPAALRPRALTLGAADDEPVDGTRHGDVEQAPVFVLGLAARAIARGAHGRGVSCFWPSPNEAVRPLRCCPR